MGAPLKVMIPIAYTTMVVALLAGYATEASIGINWGRESAQRLVPSQVVDLLLQNGVRRARIYTSQSDLLDAFAWTGINLTIGMFDYKKVPTLEKARAWVHEKNHHFSPSNVRDILFGEYTFNALIPGRDKAYRIAALKSLRWLQEALYEQGFGNTIKVNLVHEESMLKQNLTMPSEAEFIPEIIPELLDFLQYLKQQNLPFNIHQLPINDVVYNNFDPSFAYPDKASKQVITDVNGAVYTDIFQWRYDCYVWALRKLGYPDMPVAVTMVGWPTDGFPGATAANAERFFKHLLPWVKSGKGTPMRPGVSIDVNVHAVTDEPKMRGPPFTHHWGIYRSNGKPKFKIDLTGEGRDIYPTEVRGIMPMPSRWCVFSGDRKDLGKVKEQLELACVGSDCTSTLEGGSCSKLSFEQNITYAFNMYFQFKFQDEKACDFEGLGRVSVEDPSTKECLFPVEVVKGQQVDFKMPWETASAAEGIRPTLALLLLLLLHFV